ncbi:Light-sensor Protein kinase [Apostasia shenzhenica]|uniref:Light-sensor Protein kinase n=1 Tax=Apostasia shenzhenica TaxID=1088818 RepID=A0A2I0B8W6_9ASPA|nr:Light-sensor Protein kinase [Apostasia shenzhenica]
MEQFRHIGEVLGSLRALMVFRDEIRINRRQCDLLVDAFEAAFDGIGEEMRQHLRIEEKHTKWKPLEQPLKELHRIFRDGEIYIRQCLEPKDWWGRSLSLCQSTDCVDSHLHSLLWCIPVVLEAIEGVAEISGDNDDEIHKRRVVFSKKYEREWMDPMLFQHKFGKLYLTSQDMCRRMETVSKEDRWILSEAIVEMRNSARKPLTKLESRLADILTSPRGMILPSSTLLSSPDYQVRRRLGSDGRLKEIQWLGESFALKHVFIDLEQLMPKISLVSSLNHPNVMSYMYVFSDEERKECFMVMELMNKNLSTYVKEFCCPKRRVPFPLHVTIDIMLQIARGMEYLHSQNVYHGDLNPSNILVNSKSTSPDSYANVKIAGVGHCASSNEPKGPSSPAGPAGGANPCIWHAPEVLSDQDHPFPGAEAASTKKCSEKADVYSFGMICFELLTGKIPFEDGHLQGDKMSRNIRAGERPLFHFASPKFLTNLTKRCWHADPSQRPSFSSICRMLRYMKRFIILNPDNGQPELPSSPVDYYDIEMGLSRKFVSWQRRNAPPVSDIPFEMFAYRVVERERTSANLKEKSSDSGSDASVSGEENGFHATIPEDTLSLSQTSSSSGSGKSVSTVSTAISNGYRKNMVRKMEAKVQSSKQIGNHLKVKAEKAPPQLVSLGRGMRLKSESQLPSIKAVAMSPVRRKRAGHASDSELDRP